jgi:hypothetical protein
MQAEQMKQQYEMMVQQAVAAGQEAPPAPANTSSFKEFCLAKGTYLCRVHVCPFMHRNFFFGKIVSLCTCIYASMRTTCTLRSETSCDTNNYIHSNLSSSLSCNRSFQPNTTGAACKTKEDKEMWNFMSILFESNARVEISKLLGYDADQIAEMVPSVLANEEESASVAESFAPVPSANEADESIDQALYYGEEGQQVRKHPNGNHIPHSATHRLQIAIPLSSTGEIWTV